MRSNETEVKKCMKCNKILVGESKKKYCTQCNIDRTRKIIIIGFSSAYRCPYCENFNKTKITHTFIYSIITIYDVSNRIIIYLYR